MFDLEQITPTRYSNAIGKKIKTNTRVLASLKKVSDNTFSKFCGLGPEGFPYFLLRYRHLSGSPLKKVSRSLPTKSLNYHLVHTSILNVSCLANALEDFPKLKRKCLSSFAKLVSMKSNELLIYSPNSLKEGYTVYRRSTLYLPRPRRFFRYFLLFFIRFTPQKYPSP